MPMAPSGYLTDHAWQELNNKDQEKVTEVTRVRVELQEQNSHLQAKLTAQEALKEKVAALERQLKGKPSPEPPTPPVRDLGGLSSGMLGLSSQRHWHEELGVSASQGPHASPTWPLYGHLQCPVSRQHTALPHCTSSPAVIASDHREALLDRESENASLREKLRLKEAEMARIRDEEAQRASFLQNAVLAYVQGSPLRTSSPQK